MRQEIVWTLTTLILPPGILVLLGFSGLLLGRRPIGRLLVLITLTALYLLSTPYIARQLTGALEIVSALTEAQINSTTAQAIVVLGAGRREVAPEYNHQDTVNFLFLERLRYAAWLSHKSNLPLIPSGGPPRDRGPSEAALARAVLEREFGAKVLFTEERSRTTREEARILKSLLAKHGISKVLLVTHAWHMLRALDVFEAAGIEVVAAPMGFVHPSQGRPSYLAWLPSARAFLESYYALHEQLGRVWYRLSD